MSDQMEIDLDRWIPSVSSKMFPDTDPEMTVGEVQNLLKGGIRRGTVCKCCGQGVKLYKRPINVQMAVWLAVLVRVWERTRTWVAVGEKPLSLYHHGGDYAKLGYWDLVISRPDDPTTDEKGSGLWRPTERGQMFVRGQLLVPSHAHVYNDTVLGWSNKMVGFTYCLKKKFSYQEITETDLYVLADRVEVVLGKDKKKGPKDG